MKKFISMVMAASMVASLMPATAFAAKADEITGTARVVDAWDKNRDFNGVVTGDLVPEAQVRINNVDYLRTDTGNPPKARFTVRLDNAKFSEDFQKNPDDYVKFTSGSRGEAANPGGTTYAYEPLDDAALKVILGNWFDKFNDLAAVTDVVYVSDANMTTWNGTNKQNPATGEETTINAAWLQTEADSTSAPVAAGTAEDAAMDALQQYALIMGLPTSGWTLSGKVDGTDSSAKWTNKSGDVVTLADLMDWIENGTAASFTKGATSAGTQVSFPVTSTDLSTGNTDPIPAGTMAKVKAGTLTVEGVSVTVSDLTSQDTTNTIGDLLAEIKAKVEAAFAAANKTGANGTSNYSILSDVDVTGAVNAIKVDCKKTAMTYVAGQAAPPIAGVNADGNGFVSTSAGTDKDTWVTAALADLKAGTKHAAPGKLYKKSSTTTGQLPATGISRDITVEVEKKASAVAGGSQIERDDEVTVIVTGWLEKDDIISVDLDTNLKTSSKTAYFSIDSDDIRLSNDGADIVYVQVAQEGLVLSVRKLVDVAEEEVVTLDDRGLTIKTNVGEFKAGDIVLKLSKGFEFADDYKFINDLDRGDDWRIVTKNDGETVGPNATVRAGDDDDELVVTVTSTDTIDEIIIYGIDIEATSAKSGATATIRATSKGFTAATAVEVAKVVDYKVLLTKDEDEDLPVIYSGVDTDNYGITDDSDHWSVEITAKETFPGAWSFRKGFNFEMTEGVYVTDVEVLEVEGFLKTGKDASGEADIPVDRDEVETAFFNAYQNGGHVNFEFDKRVFDDVDAKLNDDKATMTFKLQLVADPGFEGDAVVKLSGDLVDDQELTVAKFVKPYEVKAEQNDMIIDYRYTEVPTSIVITEAEAGLWDSDKATFRFSIEKENLMSFEDDPTFEIDSKSDLELKSAKVKDGQITFTVKSESDEPATVTIKNIQLFMNRSIPAGPYDLSIGSSLADAYENEVLFAPDGIKTWTDRGDSNRYGINRGDYTSNNRPTTGASKEDAFVGDVCDYSDTVKEAFVNVVTAGRDVDDASFTTKVVVPVGESYIVAGEKQIELDTPAYINEAGYTMLPIRAVATALGISNNNVLWDQPTKTVTILYGQRIITMSQGQKVVYVNGSAIPASAAVENTNSRTFLPMRDLATALGVTDITWDQATRTATLNGNQK